MDYLKFIPATFQERFIQFAIGKIGRYVISGITCGISLGIGWLSTHFPGAAVQLSQVDQAKLVAAVWGILQSALHGYITTHTTRNVIALQKSLVKTGAELDVDGFVGDQTVKAIEAQGIEVRKAIAIPRNAGPKPA